MKIFYTLIIAICISIHGFGQTKLKCFGIDYGTPKDEVLRKLKEMPQGDVSSLFLDGITVSNLKSLEQYPINMFFSFDGGVLNAGVINKNVSILIAQS